MADITITRIQHRRGRKVDLPQPLRPGELGFCLDTKELFIGQEPTETVPGLHAFSSDMFATVQTHMDNDIVVSTVDPGQLPLAEATITALKNTLESQPEILEVIVNVADDKLVVAGRPASGFNNVDVVNTCLTQLGLQAYVLSTVTGASLTLDTDGFALASTHAFANAVSSAVNFVSAQGLTTSNLNLMILTEASDLATGFAADIIAQPVSINLLPSSPASSPIPELTFDVSESDIINIDYSVSFSSGTNSYTSVGKLTIAVDQTLATASLVDDNNEVSNMSNNITFQAAYSAGQVVVRYVHNFPNTVTLKTMTKRWTKF